MNHWKSRINYWLSESAYYHETKHLHLTHCLSQQRQVDRRTKVIADKKIHNKSGTIKMKCKLWKLLWVTVCIHLFLLFAIMLLLIVKTLYLLSMKQLLMCLFNEKHTITHSKKHKQKQTPYMLVTSLSLYFPHTFFSLSLILPQSLTISLSLSLLHYLFPSNWLSQ